MKFIKNKWYAHAFLIEFWVIVFFWKLLQALGLF